MIFFISYAISYSFLHRVLAHRDSTPQSSHKSQRAFPSPEKPKGYAHLYEGLIPYHNIEGIEVCRQVEIQHECLSHLLQCLKTTGVS